MSLSRFKTVLVLVLSGGALYLGVLNLVDRSQWQQATDGIQWKESLRGVEIDGFTPQSEVIGAMSLHPGDLLIGINGIPIGNLDDLTEVQELLAQRLPGNTPATYLVQHRDGSEESVSVFMIRRSRITRTDVLLGVVAGGFLIAGLLIFVRSWNTPGVFHFYLVSLVGFVLLLYRYSGRADFFDLLIYWLDVGAFLLLPPLFVHYCYRFPRSLAWLERRPLAAALLYIPGLFLLVVFAAWFADWLTILRLPRTPSLLAFFDRLHLLHFVAFLVFGAWVMVLRRSWADAAEKQQLKWVAFGTVAAIGPLLGGYGLPFLLGWPIEPWMEASVLSLLFIPLSFAYAIARYRLRDVDLFFKKSLSYLLSTSALVVLYVGLTILIGKAVEGMAGESGFFIFAVAALIVAFLFAPLQNKIQEQIDRYFYKDRYDYRQSFADFGRALSSHVSLPVLVEKLSVGLARTLDVAPVKVFLKREESSSSQTFQLFSPHAQSGSRNPVLHLPNESLRWLDLDAAAIARRKSVFPAETMETAEALGLQYLQPLRTRDRVIGLLSFGSRKVERFLSSADLHLIKTFSDYAAIALDNALLYRSLEANASELAELKGYYENVVESITVGVCVLDPEGIVTTWNSALERLYGLTSEEVVGKGIEKIFPRTFLRTLRRFTGQSGWAVPRTARLPKLHLECANQETRLVGVILAPFVSNNNTNTGTLVVLEDVTKKAQLENQLSQAEKLSSIGLFAAGVAHEVNTPLAGISSYAQMLLEDLPGDDPRRELLEKIEKQSFRASEIINNLLNFARISDTDFQEVNVNSLMLETLSLLDHSFKNIGIEVKLDLDPGLPATIGNSGRLQQVFMNLFLNARDAMPGGGEVAVLSATRDSHLLIEIRDTGGGISPDAIKKIYDPFFTTKTVGRGTGLGLSVTYGIIQEHSGRIMVESREGEGTTFTLQLPIKRLH